MSGGRRSLAPRPRSLRPIRRVPNAEGPSYPAPVAHGSTWVLHPSIRDRLHQKSALGRRIEGDVHVNAVELLFTHWHRHVELPSSTWVEDQLMHQQDFLHEAVAFEHARLGGGLLVPIEHTPVTAALGTWCLRWERSSNAHQDPPIGEVRWARGSDSLDWRELDDWTSRVEDAGRFAEVLVVDDEFEVTSYRFHHLDPTGTHLRPRDLGHEDLTHIRRLAEMEAQAGYLPDEGIEWPLPQMGVRNAGGTILSKLEWEALKDAPDEPEQDDAALLWALLDRGLLVRPGFKFGCEWRAYDLDMDATHAPWLIQPNWRSPVVWEGVCLAARLAAGVNKTWVTAFRIDGWRFLSVNRTSVRS